jgi:predicted transcriptional regulator
MGIGLINLKIEASRSPNPYELALPKCALGCCRIVFHRVKPDEAAVKLAEYEQIPLIYSASPSIEQLVKSLRKLYRIALRIKLGRHLKPPPKISA